MTQTAKPRATALNEVTVTIMRKNLHVNYHETFLVDLTKESNFEFRGKRYLMPSQNALHYKPSFWRFDLKLASFFEQHKTWAALTDWFHIRDKAIYEIGFLYDEGVPTPENLISPAVDWALENFLLSKNTSVLETYNDVDAKLKGKQDHFNALLMFGVMIVAIVGIAMLGLFLSGNLGAPTQIQHTIENVTDPMHTALTNITNTPLINHLG